MFEMKYYRRLVCITYRKEMKKECVRHLVRSLVGLHISLLTFVKRPKLKWHEHVIPDGLPKIVLQDIGRKKESGQAKETLA